MTTLKDYMRDLVKEALEEQDQATDEGKTLTEEGIDDLVDMKLDLIGKNLFGIGD